MHKKYLFFDIDGTLTDNATHKVVKSAAWTLKQLEKEGHFVAIATGRAHYKTVSFTDSLGLYNLVCCGGGCLVKDGTMIVNEPLPLDGAKELLRKADKIGLGWILMLDDSDKVYMNSYRFLEQAGLRTELTTYIYDPNLNYEDLDVIYKIYFSCDDACVKENPWLESLGLLRMGDDYVVIQHDAKNAGIRNMMKYLDAPLEDVVVFGDGKNDLVMFDPLYTSIAMGNGNEKLKEKADFVTKKNIEDGIYYACKTLGYIKEELPEELSCNHK